MKYIDTGVIVEPRCHELLLPIVKNIMDNVPEINIIIFYGNNNYNFIIDNLNNYFKNDEISKIKLINLNVNNLTVREYSDMLLTENFWNMIDGERILIFQTDSCILNYNEELLKECNKYGYVGAPTKKIREIPWQNGGFSLRKKSLMIKAVKKLKKNEKYFPEDRFFSERFRNIVNPAPWNISNKFSVEIHYNDKPFGIHKCWKYQNKENMKLLLENNPNIKFILDYYNI
jgi:hypothetical protein